MKIFPKALKWPIDLPDDITSFADTLPMILRFFEKFIIKINL